MESILRATFAFFFFLILFRVIGKRAASELTMMDFVMMTLIGGTVFYMMSAGDFSMANGITLAVTLIVLNYFSGILMKKSKMAKAFLDGVPMVLVKDGEVYEDRIRKSHVSVMDILQAGREQGIEKLEDIRYAVLEKGGNISIIKREEK